MMPTAIAVVSTAAANVRAILLFALKLIRVDRFVVVFRIAILAIIALLFVVILLLFALLEPVLETIVVFKVLERLGNSLEAILGKLLNDFLRRPSVWK